MELQQLKLLAKTIRGLLQQSHVVIGHNQSLDLIATLPGLRNWPEVIAFPDRVTSCTVDGTSVSRLAFRLKKKHGIDLPGNVLLAALGASLEQKGTRLPQIWPTGPKPGVYVTTSSEAIDALLNRYEDATDGSLVYAERAGNHWPGSIDLGEGGLWSNGLDRVPSGTLLVLGPIQLDQQSWRDSGDRLEMACLHASNSGHRMAVLVETPTPDTVCEDIALLVRTREEGHLNEGELAGAIAEDGQLELREPFAAPWHAPDQSVAVTLRSGVVPDAARAPLRNILGECRNGLLLLGSARLEEHAAIELVEECLGWTEHLGPAARIMPRHRGTPAKDWLVPDAIKALPYLPSIQTAYDRGYRRMIYDGSYTNAELLLEYGSKALLIGRTYASNVADTFMSTLRSGGIMKEAELLDHIVAILSVIPVAGKRAELAAGDLYLRVGRPPSTSRMKLDEVDGFLQANRVIRWEDELDKLLDAKVVTAAAIKHELPRNRMVAEFLSQRAKTIKASKSKASA